MDRGNPRLNQDIVRVHAEDAAFVADLRRMALDGPNYRLLDLYDLESRLHGHLDALALSGETAAERAAENLALEAGYGEIFVAGYLALRRSDTAELDRLLAIAGGSERRAEALAAAAAWCPPAAVAENMRSWIRADNPLHAWIALEVCGLRRVDPDSRLPALLAHANEAVAVRAMQLAAELGRDDLSGPILRRLAGSGGGARVAFWAAWAAVLLGERGSARDRLAAALQPGLEAPLARAAAELVPLVAPAEGTRRLVRRLLEHGATRHWALVALGSFGAVESLDWLLGQMADPLLARQAGASFGLITGARLGPDNLELDVFPQAEASPAAAGDAQEAFIEARLYWPDPEKVRAWLDANRGRFRPETRYLLGQPAWTHADPPDHPAKYQLEYRAVALELALRRPSAPLPNWRAPVTLAGGAFTRRW